LKSIAAQAVATAGLNNPVSTPTDYSTESRGKKYGFSYQVELLGLVGWQCLQLLFNYSSHKVRHLKSVILSTLPK